MNRPFQFTLAAILIAITLTAIWLVILRYLPLWAIPAAFLFPAVVRAIVVAGNRRPNEDPAEPDNWLDLYITSIYATGLSLLAGFAALVLVALPLDAVLAGYRPGDLLQNTRIDVAYSIGGIVALGVFLAAFVGSMLYRRPLP